MTFAAEHFRIAALVDLGRSIAGERLPQDSQLSHQALDALCRLVPGALAASVMTAGLRRVAISVAAGSLDDQLLATDVDACQLSCGEGPTLAVLDGGLADVSCDFTTDQRWPRFHSRIADSSRARAALSLSLESAGYPGAALTLYSDRKDAFADITAEQMEFVVGAAGLTLTAVAERQRAQNLETALISNREIGAALGVVMCRTRMTYEQAFDLLRTESQRSHRKMRMVAEEVLLTGQPPDR